MHSMRNYRSMWRWSFECIVILFECVVITLLTTQTTERSISTETHVLFPPRHTTNVTACLPRQAKFTVNNL